MKKVVYTALFICALQYCSPVCAQETDTLSKSTWNHSLAAGFYIFKDDFIFLPVYRADKDWLHLEARYIYQSAISDRNTDRHWTAISGTFYIRCVSCSLSKGYNTREHLTK
jgi:hypothetical protein